MVLFTVAVVLASAARYGRVRQPTTLWSGNNSCGISKILKQVLGVDQYPAHDWNQQTRLNTCAPLLQCHIFIFESSEQVHLFAEWAIVPQSHPLIWMAV